MQTEKERLIAKYGFDINDPKAIVRHIVATSNGRLEGVNLFDRMVKNCEMIYREKIKPMEERRARARLCEVSERFSIEEEVKEPAGHQDEDIESIYHPDQVDLAQPRGKLIDSNHKLPFKAMPARKESNLS